MRRLAPEGAAELTPRVHPPMSLRSPPNCISYTKTAKMPGGQFLKLDTVFVDVTTGVSPTNDQPYETMTIFSCIHAVATVTELVFATRVPSTPPAVLLDMERVAAAQGVHWSAADLKVVNRTTAGCA